MCTIYRCDNRRRLSCVQGDLLESEVVVRSKEGWEGPGTAKQGADVSEALIEASNHVEDEGIFFRR